MVATLLYKIVKLSSTENVYFSLRKVTLKRCLPDKPMLVIYSFQFALVYVPHNGLLDLAINTEIVECLLLFITDV